MDVRNLPASAGGGGLPSWLDAPSHWQVLDPVAERIQRFVAGLPLGRARDLLHGRWLGHPLHPALAQVPIGCWVSAGVLDLTRTPGTAARRLTAAGLVAAPVTFWAGWVDWADRPPADRRTGLVHALGAATATLLQGASLRARHHGRPLAGRLYGLAGTTVVTAAATLGAHLAYGQAAGAALAEAVPRVAPADRPAVGDVEEPARHGSAPFVR